MKWQIARTTREIIIDGQVIPEGELVQARESCSNEGGMLVRTEAGTQWFRVSPVRF
jgi:hypothetical protein